MFWNKMGSPASLDSEVTGTMEEFKLACLKSDPTTCLPKKKQDVWVYFRKPTVEPSDELDRIKAFQKELEAGKNILFRNYESVEEWEELFRQNLVAYLEGLRRRDIERALKLEKPEDGVLQGRFLAEGIYQSGTVKNYEVDLDGDGNDELVRFYFSKANYTLLVSKFDLAFNLRFSREFEEALESSTVQHLAIKDVTNDGLPEVLLAAYDRRSYSLRVAVWGFIEGARDARNLSRETFKCIGEFVGQSVVYVHEGGTLICPYGSSGLFSKYFWREGAFIESGGESLTKKYSQL